MHLAQAAMATKAVSKLKGEKALKRGRQEASRGVWTNDSKYDRISLNV